MPLITNAFLAEDGLPVLKSLMISTTMAAMLLLSPAMADEAAAPSDAAVTFVSGFSDQHLSGMLSKIGARQPVLMALGQFDGTLLGAVFDAEIDKAVLIYGDAWRANMARAWTPLLTDEELSSLTNAGAQSPYTDKYLALRGDAGQTMQALSQDLFRQILSEVIENTVSQVSAPADTGTAPASE